MNDASILQAWERWCEIEFEPTTKTFCIKANLQIESVVKAESEAAAIENFKETIRDFSWKDTDDYTYDFIDAEECEDYWAAG